MCSKRFGRGIKTALLTMSLLAPGDVSTVSAQEAENRPSAARDDDGFDMGWLGLAGLIGLAGLAGRSRDRTRHTVTTADSGRR